LTETDTDKIIITIFTDPMMGLSYECEPIFRKLWTHFPGKIEYRYMMSLLVRDIHDFMTREELALKPEEKFVKYNRRLAGIYKKEEKISGMPMDMRGFGLFDMTHTTTLPLNLACIAVSQIAKEKTEQFLYHLRYATIVKTRQTTSFDEILKVVRQNGINEKDFIEAFNSPQTKEILKENLRWGQRLGIRGLPAYLIEYKNHRRFVNNLIGYKAFVSIIEDLTRGEIVPEPVQATVDVLKDLIQRQPLICSVELRYAFDISSDEEVRQLIRPLLEVGAIEIEEVYHGWFVRRKGEWYEKNI